MMRWSPWLQLIDHDGRVRTTVLGLR